MAKTRRILRAACLFAALVLPAWSTLEARDGQAKSRSDLVVDHVVFVMRHGVRPPTKDPALPEGMAAGQWPHWPVAPGWLTPHGAEAIARLAGEDGAVLRAQGLLPTASCPGVGQVRGIADSDQRTIATAATWLEALAPHCGLSARHLLQDTPDPLFAPIAMGRVAWDPKGADAALASAIGPGGLAAREAQMAPLTARLDRILCGPEAQLSDCGVARVPTRSVPAAAGKRPRLSGMLSLASTASQSLLLEYAEGMPMDEVGWGRADAQDIAALSAFHALKFELLARPEPIARANFAGLEPFVEQGLVEATPVTLISGHDTNVANLAGILGVHWQIDGYAADDPAPGGALILESLHDRDGHHYIRVSYRAQTLEAIRGGVADGIVRQVLPLSACHVRHHPDLCTRAQFMTLLRGA